MDLQNFVEDSLNEVMLNGQIDLSHFVESKVYVNVLEKHRLAKSLGRNSGEGEAEFRSKSSEVYESCHLRTWNAREKRYGKFYEKNYISSLAFYTTNDRERR
ncbi:hypothetical protein TNCV_4406211 [Trichonephila clavipes]|nr:hypothetical protein TNCV_4406211 [Trichonephila clavipes]